MTRGEAAAYLAAMIDGEGHISTDKEGRVKGIGITNTDIDILDAIENSCSILNIKTTRSIKSFSPLQTKPGYVINIYGRENLERVAELVPIQSKVKKKKLELGLNKFRVLHIIDLGEVEDLYYLYELSVREVAEQLNIPHGVLKAFMKKNNMQFRTKDEAQQVRRRKERNAV